MEVQPQYFIGSHAAIVVYDVTVENPLSDVIGWIDRYIEYSGNAKESVLVFQNKTDLISPTQEMQSIAKHEEFIERLYICYHRRLKIIGKRTSAKTGDNIKSSLNMFFKTIVERYETQLVNQIQLNNQIEKLYVKSAYVMSFDEDYGPLIV